MHYPDRPDASHALVDFMQVTSAEHRPELAPVEAQLQPVLVNAVVSVWKYTEATHAVYEYDEQGQLIRESSQKLARAASLPGGRRFARLAVPWVAAGAGSAVCLGLLLVTRRRS